MNRCSPTEPEKAEESISEIVYRRSDHDNNANLSGKLHVINVETGSYRVIGDIDEGSPIVWRSKTGEIVRVRTQPSDGVRYLLASNSNGSEGLMRANLSSLFSGAVKSLSLSPEQDSVAVVGGESGFYLFKMDTMNVSSKVGSEKVVYAKFSPGKKKIALLIADSAAVYLVTTSGRIENKFGLSFPPKQLKWSPDGNKIACWNERTHAALFKIADTTAIEYPNLGDITWSPDSNELVFSDSHTNLGKMNADGSNRVLLGTTGMNVQWSPNGKYLAFCEPSGNEHLLIVSGAKGENQKTVAMLSSPVFVWRPL